MYENAPLYWSALIFGVSAFSVTKRKVRQAVLAKRDRQRKLDISSFIETGTLNKTIHSLAGRDLETVITRRREVLDERAEEQSQLGFHASVVCPMCFDFNTHWMNEVAPGVLKRECRKCAYVWKVHAT